MNKRFGKYVFIGVFVAIGFLCLQFAASAAEPIKVGCPLALTGVSAKPGQWLERGYKVWVDEVNEAGGLLGRPVELVIYDDESNPAKAVKLFEKLISIDKIELAFSPYSSSVCLPATTVTEKYKMPMVCNGASPEIYSRGYRYVFATFPPLETEEEGILLMAKERGYKKVAICNYDGLDGKSWGRDTVKLAREMGLDVVAHEEYSKNVTDLSAVISRLKKVKPRLISAMGRFPDGSIFIRQAREFGLYVDMISYHVASADPKWYTMLGETGNYVLNETVWDERLPGEANKKFVERFYKVYGDRFKEIEYHAAMGYAQGKIVEYVVKKVGSIDNEKIRSVLATDTISNILIGQYKVQPNGYQNPIEGMKWGVYQWINGKKEVVWPDEYKTHDPVIPMPKWEERR